MVVSKKKFLQKEFENLELEGLITSEQKKRILARYNLKQGQSASILNLFASLFIALSLLNLVAYNWEDLNDITKSALLLFTLFLSHLGIFYFKNRNNVYAQSIAFLSSFILLANLALLSQIYHLGENTPLAFLSVSITTLFMAVALWSFWIFLQSYIFAAFSFCLAFFEFHELYFSFFCFILLGFCVNFFKCSKILAFLNFVFLYWFIIVYLDPGLDQEFFLYFIFMVLSFLFMHLKHYKIYAFLIISLLFIFRSATNTDEPMVSMMCLPWLKFCISLKFSISLVLLVFIALHLYKKHFLLSFIITLVFLNLWISEIYYSFDKIYYSFLTLLFGVYLIREKYIFLGSFNLIVLAIIRYIDLFKDYLGACILFFIFGVISLILAKKWKNEK